MTIVGKSAPVMNDATTQWLKYRSENDFSLRDYLDKLHILSSGNAIGGTDLANTSHEFNEAFLTSDAVIAWGNTNAESLVQGQALTRPVLGITFEQEGRSF